MTTRDGRLRADRRGHSTPPCCPRAFAFRPLQSGRLDRGESPPFLVSSPRSDMMRASKFCAWLMVACSGLALPARAQGPNGNRPPEFASPEVSPERKVTFRVHAPKAEAVRLGSSDMPGMGIGGRDEEGRQRRLGGDRRPRPGGGLSLQLPGGRRWPSSTRATPRPASRTPTPGAWSSSRARRPST